VQAAAQAGTAENVRSFVRSFALLKNEREKCTVDVANTRGGTKGLSPKCRIFQCTDLSEL